MAHFVRRQNLPYSIEDIKQMNASCPACAELKPRFYGAAPGRLIKATSPFERLNIDFKGPLPTETDNRYIFTVVDEYSRFPFAFPCSDMTSGTVVKCLSDLFAMFGKPSYIHSDRGPCFMSAGLKQFLLEHGIATSRTTGYNPQGNGQVERYNGVIWKAVTLALKSRGLGPERWEVTLLDALNSIRSLLCTSTNATPHERMFTHQRRYVDGQTG
uniref:Integrase catalytic domain-containing protein n=1 Tax=Eptatretus burgeri TaxID=7764 RepID=A0A8C4X0X2_EPTBU